MKFMRCKGGDLCNSSSMRYFFILLWLSSMCAAKTVELSFPGLKHRVLIALPDNYNPQKKYPAVFYYHGTNGVPNTSFVLEHVDSREWIVVGMAYQQLGRFTLTPENLGKELSLLQSVRRHLELKYSLDQNKCYITGFSKGGWMTDMLLQLEPNLAGGAILGAGHMHNLKNLKIAVPKKRTKRNVYIGVGRMDGNYPMGLAAVIFHRGRGAYTTFDPWYGLGHQLPREGSTALQQWFALQLYASKDIKEIALAEMQGELKAAEKLDPYQQWALLRQLENFPYTQVLGEEWKKTLLEKKSALEAKPPVKIESGFLVQHQKLLVREVRAPSLKTFESLAKDYLALIKKAPATKQAELARHDQKRVSELLVLFQEQAKEKAAEKKNGFDPVDQDTRRRIPRNPLVK